MDIEQSLTGGSPAFGTADLNNCELEQIHLPSSIQPHGALLVFDPVTRIVSRESTNAAAFLNLAFDSLLGLNCSDFGPELGPQLAEVLDSLSGNQPNALPVTVHTVSNQLDCLSHRTADDELVLEFEPLSEGEQNLSSILHSGIEAVSAAASVQAVCDLSTQLFKQLLGFDHVMVYRFDIDGHGEVVSESREPEVESYLGNHYPASDIPQIARRLYCRNRIRALPDVAYEPVPVQPQVIGTGSNSSVEAGLLDMSMSHLRSMSPMHRQYLTNMGVDATLAASLIVGDSLWGLVTCHHQTSRQVGYEMRVIAESLAEIISTRLSALESLDFVRAEEAVRQLEHQIINVIGRDGAWLQGIIEKPDLLLRPLDATGAALILDEEIVSIGSTPDDDQLRNLAAWVTSNTDGRNFFCNSIKKSIPALESFPSDCAGVLCSQISHSHPEYVMWFRGEHIRSVTWGGNPDKPVDFNDETQRISPRNSFAKWHQLLKDTSRPWTGADVNAASMIGETLSDVIQQFRAIRLLIAHRQLDTITTKAHESIIPAAIFGPDGSVLLTNEAFNSMMWEGSPELQHLKDIPRLFDQTLLANHSLQLMLEEQTPWRGQVTLNGQTVMVRADPVMSNPETVLGYVVLLNNVTEKLSSQDTRKLIPNRTLDRYRAPPPGTTPEQVAIYNRLLGAVVDNAKLAACEIADGVNPARVPRMLQGVEVSVSRTSALLSNLIRHAKPKFPKNH